MGRPSYQKCKDCVYFYADADDCFYEEVENEKPDCEVIKQEDEE